MSNQKDPRFSKFKRGDKVRLKKDLIIPNNVDSFFKKNIQNALGKTLVVRSIHFEYYRGYDNALDGNIPIWVYPYPGTLEEEVHIPDSFLEKIRHSNPIKRNSNMRDGLWQKSQ